MDPSSASFITHHRPGNLFLQAATDIEITGSLFALNSAVNGGAVQINSNAIVLGCDFDSNECTGAGPALYVSLEANATIIDSRFRSLSFES